LSAKRNQRGALSPKRTWPLAAAAFLSRRSRIIALLAVALAWFRIAATYTVFNQTFDEPLHIACGIEWLGGVICADETPPLARVAEAVGPYLLGARSSGKPYRDMESEYAAGAAMLYRQDYDLTLALARLGNLPSFWLACLVVFLVVFGQPPAARLKFEVASVKPSAPEAQGMFTRYLPGGGFAVYRGYFAKPNFVRL
jgi:hypothetical protein